MYTLQDELHAFLSIPLLYEKMEGYTKFVIPENADCNAIKLNEIAVPNVLGKRLEHLMGLQLNCREAYNILHQNIQLIEEKNTLGELDFILETNEGKQTHVELACKFYLLDPSVSPNFLEQWIGPNRKDTLVKKVSKLVNHQFPLLFSNTTKERCTNIDFSQIQQQICYKAFLFTPAQYNITNWHQLNPNCWAGKYYSFKDFVAMDFSNDIQFYLPKKQHWFLEPNTHTPWQNFNTFLEALEFYIHQNRSPLCWMKNAKEEWQRFFVCSW